MISDAVERRIGIKNTRAFIDAKPTTIVLKRPQKVTTPAGGVLNTEPVDQPPQTGRIIPMSGLVWDRTRLTPDEGQVPDVTEILILMPDSNVQQEDYFANDTSLGGWFEVLHVSPMEGYRKEARLRWSRAEPKA